VSAPELRTKTMKIETRTSPRTERTLTSLDYLAGRMFTPSHRMDPLVTKNVDISSS
jgi:hypothetical protein